jgi:SAM-dependent methyltransferase
MRARDAGRAFDARHRVVTEALLFLGELDAEYLGEAAAHATHYEPVPIADFEAMLEMVPEETICRSAFVDVGSGLGRAVFLAMRAPFREIVGVEVSAALNETAKENLEKLRMLDIRCRDVRLANADARTFDYPSGDLVVFLFNPFDADALRDTLRKIAAREAPGRTHLLYHTPEQAHVAAEFGFELLRVAEYAAVALAVDVEQDADRHEVGQDGGAAIGHERERDAGDRHDADRHADVDQHVEREHRH